MLNNSKSIKEIALEIYDNSQKWGFKGYDSLAQDFISELIFTIFYGREPTDNKEDLVGNLTNAAPNSMFNKMLEGIEPIKFPEYFPFQIDKQSIEELQQKVQVHYLGDKINPTEVSDLMLIKAGRINEIKLPNEFKDINEYKSHLEQLSSFVLIRTEFYEYFNVANNTFHDTPLHKVGYLNVYPRFSNFPDRSLDDIYFCTDEGNLIDDASKKQELKDKFKDILRLQLSVAGYNHEALNLLTPNAFFERLTDEAKSEAKQFFSEALAEVVQEKGFESCKGVFFNNVTNAETILNQDSKIPVQINKGDSGAPHAIASQNYNFKVAESIMSDDCAQIGNCAIKRIMKKSKSKVFINENKKAPDSYFVEIKDPYNSYNKEFLKFILFAKESSLITHANFSADSKSLSFSIKKDKLKMFIEDCKKYINQIEPNKYNFTSNVSEQNLEEFGKFIRQFLSSKSTYIARKGKEENTFRGTLGILAAITSAAFNEKMLDVSRYANANEINPTLSNATLTRSLNFLKTNIQDESAELVVNKDRNDKTRTYIGCKTKNLGSAFSNNFIEYLKSPQALDLGIQINAHPNGAIRGFLIPTLRVSEKEFYTFINDFKNTKQGIVGALYNSVKSFIPTMPSFGISNWWGPTSASTTQQTLASKATTPKIFPGNNQLVKNIEIPKLNGSLFKNFIKSLIEGTVYAISDEQKLLEITKEGVVFNFNHHYHGEAVECKLRLTIERGKVKIYCNQGFYLEKIFPKVFKETNSPSVIDKNTIVLTPEEFNTRCEEIKCKEMNYAILSEQLMQLNPGMVKGYIPNMPSLSTWRDSTSASTPQQTLASKAATPKIIPINNQLVKNMEIPKLNESLFKNFIKSLIEGTVYAISDEQKLLEVIKEGVVFNFNHHYHGEAVECKLKLTIERGKVKIYCNEGFYLEKIFPKVFKEINSPSVIDKNTIVLTPEEFNTRCEEIKCKEVNYAILSEQLMQLNPSKGR